MQVAKTIQALLPVPGPKPNEAERKELEEMEKEKVAIDNRADKMVRRELWGGLWFSDGANFSIHEAHILGT
jgi:hypothetical protein